MPAILRRLAVASLVVGSVAYGVARLSGPRGLLDLFDKQRRIADMDRKIAELEDANAKLRTGIEDLQGNPDVQGLAIREQLEKIKRGEKKFNLPETK